jgi:hypothetical protein
MNNQREYDTLVFQYEEERGKRKEERGKRKEERGKAVRVNLAVESYYFSFSC